MDSTNQSFESLHAESVRLHNAYPNMKFHLCLTLLETRSGKIKTAGVVIFVKRLATNILIIYFSVEVKSNVFGF